MLYSNYYLRGYYQLLSNCWLSQFRKAKLREPTGQRLNNVRAQQKRIQLGQSYSYLMRKFWHHQIWIQNNLGFMVSDLILVLTCTNNCRMNRIHRPPWCELPEPSPDRNWSCCIQSCPSQQFRNVVQLIYWVDSPIAAKYIWASRLFHTLPGLPLDWSYHRDLENFDEVAILPVKIYFFNSMYLTLGVSH